MSSIKGAIEAKRAAEEANKTAEEKLAAAQTEAAEAKASADSMRELLSKEAKAKIGNQPEALQKLVTEHAGDDPVKQMSYMASESFKAISEQMSGNGGTRTQGTLRQSAGGQESSSVRKKYEELKADSTDMSKTHAERADASKRMYAFQKQHSKEIFAV